MLRLPVTSSNIKSVGYDPKIFTLEVQFTDGRVYQYFNVPQLIYQNLLQAPSKGKFFASSIKKVYGFRRV